MQKLEFRENKVLKLTNVLSRKVPRLELFSQDKQYIMLQNWIKAKRYESVGPLIVCSSGVTGVDKDGNPIIDSRLLVQLKQGNVRVENQYKFYKEIRIEHCNMVRFHDEPENLQYATNKIMLHAYENDLQLNGESYMVMINEEGGKLLCDVFMPVEQDNADGVSSDMKVIDD